MPARIRTRPLEIETDRRTVPLVLDLDRGSALFDWDNRRYSVRPLRWRAKIQLARFAHLGPEFIDDRLLELSLENQPTPDDDELRDVVRTVARWLESAGRTEAPLPFDELELLRSARELSRDTGWTIDEIGDLEAGVVERAIERVRSRRESGSVSDRDPRPAIWEVDAPRDPSRERSASDSMPSAATQRTNELASPRRSDGPTDEYTDPRRDVERSEGAKPLRPGATRIIVLPDPERGDGESTGERSDATDTPAVSRETEASRAISELERRERSEPAAGPAVPNERARVSPVDRSRPSERATLPFRVRPHSESRRPRSTLDAIDRDEPHARAHASPAGGSDERESSAAPRVDSPRMRPVTDSRAADRRESVSATTENESSGRAFERSFFPEPSPLRERPEPRTLPAFEEWIEELTRRLTDTVEDLGLTEER